MERGGNVGGGSDERVKNAEGKARAAVFLAIAHFPLCCHKTSPPHSGGKEQNKQNGVDEMGKRPLSNKNEKGKRFESQRSKEKKRGGIPVLFLALT